MSRSLVLIGARGAGKTTVGRLLAERLGGRFGDVDAEAAGGASIRDIFAEHGERHWRALEAQALERLVEAGIEVIAAGGGLACVEPGSTMLEALQAKGLVEVIWLECSPEIMRSRLDADLGDRPALTGEDPVAEAVSVARSRAGRYRQVADRRVDASGRPEDVVAAIVE